MMQNKSLSHLKRWRRTMNKNIYYRVSFVFVVQWKSRPLRFSPWSLKVREKRNSSPYRNNEREKLISLRINQHIISDIIIPLVQIRTDIRQAEKKRKKINTSLAQFGNSRKWFSEKKNPSRNVFVSTAASTRWGRWWTRWRSISSPGILRVLYGKWEDWSIFFVAWSIYEIIDFISIFRNWSAVRVKNKIGKD